jgi:adenine-specific DNA-methyltransferase
MIDLFTGLETHIPKTEGIKYAGSKLKLIPYILKIVRRLNPKSVFDGFTGTTRVAQALAQTGYRVVANDLSVWSEIFAKCYLVNAKSKPHYEKLLLHLNNLPPKDGWFTENYGALGNAKESVGKDGLKKPWQIHNTRRLDAIREEIDLLPLDESERAVVLTSLIYALDDVDSTLGHYASYLNSWSPRSYKTMRLTIPSIFKNDVEHTVTRSDIFNILSDIEVDLAYYDPPYGSNNEKMPPSRVRYAAYYHLWTTICLNDKPPVFGKAMRRVDTSDKVASSVFEDFRRDATGKFIVVDALERLIKGTRAQHIILSYSSGGRATADQISEVINDNGKIIEIIEVDYKKNVMAEMRWTNEWTKDAEEPNREFLFVLQTR